MESLSQNLPQDPPSKILHMKQQASQEYSNFCRYDFVIFIVVGVGCLIGAAIGFAQLGTCQGWWCSTCFKHMSQVDTIIMLVVSGVTGIFFLSFGVYRYQRRPKSDDLTIESKTLEDPKKSYEIKGKTLADIQHVEINVIGRADWETYIGDIGPEPLLPENIESILNSRDPFNVDENIKVKDTHMLVLIPGTVNGQKLTLNYLGKLIEKPLSGTPAHFDVTTTSSSSVVEALGDVAIEHSYWALMTKKVIEQTREKSYEEQKQFLGKHNYSIGKLMEHVICLVLPFIPSGAHVKYSMGRCLERLEGQQPVSMPSMTPDGGISFYAQSDGGAGLFKVAGVQRFKLY